ncbi:MAG: rhomboid family intramembrane serine protease [Candidatus Hydrogenedentota bacterium]
MALNLFVQVYASYLGVLGVPPSINKDLKSMEEEYDAEAQALYKQISAEYTAALRSGGSTEGFQKRYEDGIHDLERKYSRKAQPLLDGVPFIGFLRTFGVYPDRYNRGMQEIHGRLRSGVDKILWYGVTFISYQYLHGDWSHFFWNMVFLLLFGLTIEFEIGSLLFLAFYHLGGIASAITQVGINPGATTLLIGASGSIAAVMGGFLIVAPTAQISLGWILGPLGFLLGRTSAAIFLLIWIGGNYLNGVSSLGEGGTGGVAWFAHVGGFAIGVGWFLAMEAREVFR